MNRKPLPKKIQCFAGKRRKHPFDSMKYGEFYVIPCEKKDSRKIGHNLHAVVASRNPIDYKIKTKFIGEGLSVRKIKKTGKS